MATGSSNSLETPNGEIAAMRLGPSMEPDDKMHVEFLMKKKLLRKIPRLLVISTAGDPQG